MRKPRKLSPSDSGIAVSVMLPHVVRWNHEVVGDRYAELDPSATLDETSPVSTSAAPEDMPPLPAGTRCAPLENP